LDGAGIAPDRDNAPGVFAALLQQVYSLAAERGLAYLVIGLTERDPLLPTASRYPHIAYYSRLYVASWEDGRGFSTRLNNRVPYIEIAALEQIGKTVSGVLQ